MNSLLLIIIVFIGYILAYHTYGRFIAKKIFQLNPMAVCPSEEMRDDKDFIPSNKHILFGHHFTSIAGLGPIVGPAIAVIWGWVPAIIWVFLGSIFMGAIHDFGALVISLRNQGRSIGDVASEIINTRVRKLFLLIIFFELWIIIAVFALIIAILFQMYPQAVLPIWFEIPIALYLGYLVYKKGKNHIKWGIVAVIVMYLTILLGIKFPIILPNIFGYDPIVIWIIIMLVYAFIASTMPVQFLLQPRDYINSHQLLIAMGLLILGIVIAQPIIIAPPVVVSPTGAPPIIPFLFVVIACGAISGFHSLISSGTSSKQCKTEVDAKFIGFGGMLTEGALATLVIVALTAGIGMGLIIENGQTLFGVTAFTQHYSDWAAASGLAAKLDAYINGSANIVGAIGIPKSITIAIMGVFIVSFAATTMDSATRIQRYVVSELANVYKMPVFSNKYVATTIAIVSAFILAFYNGSGKGALTLWPLWGTVNQLLAGLTLLVITIYLLRKHIKIRYTIIPMFSIIFMTGWAMIVNIRAYFEQGNCLLFGIGLVIFLLELWMIIESINVIIVLRKDKIFK